MKYRITPCFSDIFSKYQEENEVVHIVVNGKIKHTNMRH